MLNFSTKYDLKYAIKEIVNSLKKNKIIIKKADHMGNYEIIRKVLIVSLSQRLVNIQKNSKMN